MLKIGNSEVVDLKTASEQLKVTEATLKRYTKEGILPAEKLYGKIWVKRETLQEIQGEGKSKLRKKAFLKRRVRGVKPEAN